jgi:uncharacterized 2Fe-2S/4Fe-4S cluster protein (DUF4445 family)
VGICGSGLIDFLAEAFRAGLVTGAGRFDRALMETCPRLRPAAGHSHMLEYVVAEREETEDATHEITVTEKDIETLLAAKAAIFAAFHILVKRMGKTFEDLETVYLAGGFARYIKVENAILIGLLPEIDPQRYLVIGNGSLAGAYIALIDRKWWSLTSTRTSRTNTPSPCSYRICRKNSSPKPWQVWERKNSGYRK